MPADCEQFTRHLLFAMYLLQDPRPNSLDAPLTLCSICFNVATGRAEDEGLLPNKHLSIAGYQPVVERCLSSREQAREQGAGQAAAIGRGRRLQGGARI